MGICIYRLVPPCREGPDIIWRVANPRVVLAVGVAIVAVAVGVGLVALGGGDGGKGGSADGDKGPVAPRVVRAALKLEQYTRPDTGESELLASIPSPRFNGADMVRGTPLVWLQCFDATGKSLFRYAQDWPLLEEVGYPPHIHQLATARVLRSIRRCSVTGVGVDFEGSVTGRLPVSQ